MFRHKDRLLKCVRIRKAKNCNKQRKRPVGGTGGSIGLYHSPKVYQQHLENVTSIKLHKNTLRHYMHDSFEPMKIYDGYTYDEIKNASQEIDNIPLPPKEYTHDKTKWDYNKKHDIARNKKNFTKTHIKNYVIYEE